jgi:hypothetical protein
MYERVFGLLRTKFEIEITWKHLQREEPSQDSFYLTGMTFDQDSANIIGKPYPLSILEIT